MAAVNHKRLHKRALPVIIFAIGLFIASAVGINQFVQHSRQTNNSLTRLLSVRLLNVQPGTNGLLHISRYNPNAQADTSASLRGRSSSGLGDISSSGSAANLSVSLDALGEANP